MLDPRSSPPHALERVTVLGVVRVALAMYRRFPGRVVIIAAAVFGPVTLLDVAVHRFLGHVHAANDVELVLVGSIAAASSGAAIAFGELLFSGVIDESVGATLDGERVPEVWTTVRSLPLGTLLAADLLLAAVAAIASALIVVPALVVVTLTCIVGPVVIVERPSAPGALMRSASLVSRHLATALLTVAVPISVEGGVVEQIVRRADGTSLLAIAVMGAIVGMSLCALTGLCEVVLGRTLIRLDVSANASDNDGSRAGRPVDRLPAHQERPRADDDEGQDAERDDGDRGGGSIGERT